MTALIGPEGCSSSSSYLSRGNIHHLLTDEIRLVSHQQPGDVLTGVAVDLIQPLPHVVEGLLEKTAALTTAFKALCDGRSTPTCSVTSYTMMMP